MNEFKERVFLLYCEKFFQNFELRFAERRSNIGAKWTQQNFREDLLFFPGKTTDLRMMLVHNMSSYRSTFAASARIGVRNARSKNAREKCIEVRSNSRPVSVTHYDVIVSHDDVRCLFLFPLPFGQSARRIGISSVEWQPPHITNLSSATKKKKFAR